MTDNANDRWGIWNSVEKRFVFGISEPSMKEAKDEFRRRCGSPLWRYSVKKIPEGWTNPKNHRYAKEGLR